MFVCVVPLSQPSSQVMFAFVVPLSHPSSRVIINVFGYMLNVCLYCPIISGQLVIINVFSYM